MNYKAELQKSTIEKQVAYLLKQIQKYDYKDMVQARVLLMAHLQACRAQQAELLDKNPNLKILYNNDPKVLESALTKFEKSSPLQELQDFYQQALKLKTLETDAQTYQLTLSTRQHLTHS